MLAVDTLSCTRNIMMPQVKEEIAVTSKSKQGMSYRCEV